MNDQVTRIESFSIVEPHAAGDVVRQTYTARPGRSWVIEEMVVGSTVTLELDIERSDGARITTAPIRTDHLGSRLDGKVHLAHPLVLPPGQSLTLTAKVLNADLAGAVGEVRHVGLLGYETGSPIPAKIVPFYDAMTWTGAAAGSATSTPFELLVGAGERVRIDALFFGRDYATTTDDAWELRLERLDGTVLIDDANVAAIAHAYDGLLLLDKPIVVEGSRGLRATFTTRPSFTAAYDPTVTLVGSKERA